MSSQMPRVSQRAEGRRRQLWRHRGKCPTCHLDSEAIRRIVQQQVVRLQIEVHDTAHQQIVL